MNGVIRTLLSSNRSRRLMSTVAENARHYPREMHLGSASTTQMKQPLLFPIIVGGLVAGSFDLTSAFITFGFGVPRAIAAGLLGRQALHGGVGTWILGVFLHYFIAYSAATVYCVASRRLEFLRPHFLVCGMFYGIAVFPVMNLIVLPLSGLHHSGTYQLRALIQGILVHMFLIGVPIAFSLYKFSTSERWSRRARECYGWLSY